MQNFTVPFFQKNLDSRRSKMNIFGKKWHIVRLDFCKFPISIHSSSTIYCCYMPKIKYSVRCGAQWDNERVFLHAALLQDPVLQAREGRHLLLNTWQYCLLLVEKGFQSLGQRIWHSLYVTIRPSDPDSDGSVVFAWIRIRFSNFSGSGSGFQISLDPDPVSAPIPEQKGVQKGL